MHVVFSYSKKKSDSRPLVSVTVSNKKERVKQKKTSSSVFLIKALKSLHIQDGKIRPAERYMTKEKRGGLKAVAFDRSPSDIWSLGKEPIAIFDFTKWHASFADFFIKLRRYTAIGKQLLISNNKNRVR